MSGASAAWHRREEASFGRLRDPTVDLDDPDTSLARPFDERRQQGRLADPRKSVHERDEGAVVLEDPIQGGELGIPADERSAFAIRAKITEQRRRGGHGGHAATGRATAVTALGAASTEKTRDVRSASCA